MGGDGDTRGHVTSCGPSGDTRTAENARERAWPGLAGLVRAPFDAVIDFLVEDGCTLCRRPHDHRSRTALPVNGPARYFVEPVTVRCLLGVLSVVNHPVCVRCARDLVAARSAGVLDLPAGVHASVTDRGDSPGIARDAGERGALPLSPVGGGVAVVAPFMTTDGVLQIVHQLKFNGYTGLAHPIGRAVGWALRQFAGTSGGFGLLVPTPMDGGSHRRRGFNQAERIARSLAIDLGAPVAEGVLRKTVPTARQSLTPREKRPANVRGAFSCPPEARSVLAGQPVVLVDDLVTSGATAAVCAEALLGGGAVSVTVACLGRAL